MTRHRLLVAAALAVAAAWTGRPGTSLADPVAGVYSDSVLTVTLRGANGSYRGDLALEGYPGTIELTGVPAALSGSYRFHGASAPARAAASGRELRLDIEGTAFRLAAVADTAAAVRELRDAAPLGIENLTGLSPEAAVRELRWRLGGHRLVFLRDDGGDERERRFWDLAPDGRCAFVDESALPNPGEPDWRGLPCSRGSWTVRATGGGPVLDVLFLNYADVRYPIGLRDGRLTLGGSDGSPRPPATSRVPPGADRPPAGFRTGAFHSPAGGYRIRPLPRRTLFPTDPVML